MKKELGHFYIGNSYGGNQDWFRTFMMRLGGCGAETACDSSIYFALHKGFAGLYPYSLDEIKRKEYVNFAHMMENYLWPRMSGIDRLEIFVDGYGKYLKDSGVDGISMEMLDGSRPFEEAAAALRNQIDNGIPVPMLVLNIKYRELKDYNWHWFLVNGYDLNGEEMKVKAVTYSEYEWIDFRKLWETGYERRGGLILFRVDENDQAKADY